MAGRVQRETVRKDAGKLISNAKTPTLKNQRTNTSQKEQLRKGASNTRTVLENAFRKKK